jgi:hypothetical protein
MQSDTDLIENIRDYIKLKPFSTAYDVVEYFNGIGIPKEKVLFVLREING